MSRLSAEIPDRQAPSGRPPKEWRRNIRWLPDCGHCENSILNLSVACATMKTQVLPVPLSRTASIVAGEGRLGEGGLSNVFTGRLQSRKHRDVLTLGLREIARHGPLGIGRTGPGGRAFAGDGAPGPGALPGRVGPADPLGRVGIGAARSTTPCAPCTCPARRPARCAGWPANCRPCRC